MSGTVVHFDQVGGVRELTDAWSNTIKSYAYEPFGRILRESGSAPNDFMFPATYEMLRDVPGVRLSYTRLCIAMAGAFAGRDWRRYGTTGYACAYAQGDPLARVDPSGAVIIAACSIDDYLGQNSLYGWQMTKRNGDFVYSGFPTSDKGLEEDILRSMIIAERQFRIFSDPTDAARQGKSLQEYLVQNLKWHVRARVETVRAAETKKFQFPAMDPDTQRLEESWRQVHWAGSHVVQPTSSASEAIRDIWSPAWGSRYALGCRAATYMTVLKGVVEATQATFGEPGIKTLNQRLLERKLRDTETNVVWLQRVGKDEVWVPGDWGYVSNLNPRPPVGLEGENILYVGKGRWWGHIGQAQVYRTIQGWEQEMSREPWWPGLPRVERKWGQLDSWRKSPRVGLRVEQGVP